MLTRLVRVQVSLFVVIALLGVSYVGARYAGLTTWFGNSGYVVKLRLADSGGIFTHAEVTYRGVTIGRVGDLRLTDTGVEVDLRIDSGTPQVPRDLDAVVADRSAVGEQYVDLRPHTSAGPYLTDGSVVDQSRTALPLPTETLLLNLDRLVASVPPDSLRTVVDELDNATRDTGPSMQAILDSMSSITKLATQHLPQTTQLLTDADTVLATQVANANAIASFGANAKLVAAQLAKSDGDLRTVLSSAPAAARQISDLLRETGPGLGVLLANLLTTSDVLVTRQGAVEQLLVVTPQAVNAAGHVVRSDGAHFGLATTFFAPLPCTAGYQGTQYRNGLDTSSAPLNTQARCAVAAGSPTDVRGSQNAPNGGVPAAAKPGAFQISALLPQPGASADPPPSLAGLLGLPA